MQGVLQIIGAVISIASMIFIDVLVMKKHNSSNGKGQDMLMFCAGLIFGSVVGILVFSVFNAISTLF